MLLENLRSVLGRIEAAARRAGRDPSEVELVAVTKKASADSIAELARSGLVRQIGENRVQDASRKKSELEGRGLPKLAWRMIGHLQGNKARQAAELFDAVDSLDSLQLAGRLDAELSGEGRTMPVLVQVKLTGKESQSGIAPEEVGEFVERARGFRSLDVRGLMAIAPMPDAVEEVRPHFRRMKELLDRNFPADDGRRPVLSMGMSRDYEIAVEEGATMVRVGGALFA